MHKVGLGRGERSAQPTFPFLESLPLELWVVVGCCVSVCVRVWMIVCVGVRLLVCVGLCVLVWFAFGWFVVSCVCDGLMGYGL